MFCNKSQKKEVFIIYEIFKAEVERQKRLLHLTNADIAEKTGFKKSTIDFFMCGKKSREDSKSVAIAIARVLMIEL